MNGGRTRVFQNSNPLGGPGMTYLPMAFVDTSQYFHEFAIGNRASKHLRARVQIESPQDRAENEDNKGYLDNYFDCMERLVCNCLVGFVSTSFKCSINGGN